MDSHGQLPTMSHPPWAAPGSDVRLDENWEVTGRLPTNMADFNEIQQPKLVIYMDYRDNTMTIPLQYRS